MAPSVSRGLSVEKLTPPRASFSFGDGAVEGQPFGKEFGSTYQERHKTSKSFDPVLPFLGIYPKEITLNRDKVLCTKFFSVISFIIRQNGNSLIVQ